MLMKFMSAGVSLMLEHLDQQIREDGQIWAASILDESWDIAIIQDVAQECCEYFIGVFGPMTERAKILEGMRDGVVELADPYHPAWAPAVDRKVRRQARFRLSNMLAQAYWWHGPNIVITGESGEYHVRNARSEKAGQGIVRESSRAAKT